MILESIDACLNILSSHTKKYNCNLKIAMTSMPGDPLHPGHVSCLQSLRKAVDKWSVQNQIKSTDFVIICVVNDDNFLINKKGFAFMPLDDRMTMIDSIKYGPDFVVPFHPSDKNDQTVCEAISKLHPTLFLKGGDRKADETLPEWNICKEIGCTILDQVGADKIWSSSNYLNNYKNFILSNCK